MILADAVSEPFLVYQEWHESLNNFVKIAAASFEYLRTLTDQADGVDRLKEFVMATGEPWGPLRDRDAKMLRVSAIENLSRFGVVHAFSAFEDFLVQTRAECDRWRHANGLMSYEGSEKDSDRNIKLAELYRIYGWNYPNPASYDKIFQYFQFCRNCIVHRFGFASEGLREHSLDPIFLAQLKNWPGLKTDRQLPELPVLNVGEQIPFAPRHAIMASATCFRVAEEINQQIINTLGDDGMINMAMHYALVEDQHPSRRDVHHSPEAAVTWFLTDRYHVQKVDQNVVRESLVRMGVYEQARARYFKLYNNDMT